MKKKTVDMLKPAVNTKIESIIDDGGEAPFGSDHIVAKPTKNRCTCGTKQVKVKSDKSSHRRIYQPQSQHMDDKLKVQDT